MDKPILLFKYHMPDIYHKTYSKIDEALTQLEHSPIFPGEMICIYNLETHTYIQTTQLANRFAETIIDTIKEKLQTQNG